MKTVTLLLGSAEEGINDRVEGLVREACGQGGSIKSVRTARFDEFVRRGCEQQFDLVVVIPQHLLYDPSEPALLSYVGEGARAIRSIKSQRSVPILALVEKKSCFEMARSGAGMDCVLELPFNDAELKSAAARLLKRPISTSLASSVLETCLYVESLSQARDFYTSVFGYPVLQADERFCALKAGEHQVLILFSRGMSARGTASPSGSIPAHDGSGPAHIGFGIAAESLSAWQVRLQERRIPIEASVRRPSGGTSIYFRDPDKHLVELATPGTWAVY